MSTLFSTNAIILSRRDFQEADRWYSALTREHGKVEFRARGACKPLAKLTPHLEMPAEVELLLVNGRKYFTVAGVERRRTFPNIYSNASKLVLARNALYLADIGTKEREQDIDLYPLLVNWLSFVDQSPELTPERSGFLLSSFTLKMLALAGYRPQLTKCLSCKKSLVVDEVYWHGLRGGAVCVSCVKHDSEQWFSARKIEVNALKLVRFALERSFEDQLRPHLSGSTLSEVHEAIESLIVSHFPVIPAASLRAACLV